jgi:hypothetical protein
MAKKTNNTMVKKTNNTIVKKKNNLYFVTTDVIYKIGTVVLNFRFYEANKTVRVTNNPGNLICKLKISKE